MGLTHISRDIASDPINQYIRRWSQPCISLVANGLFSRGQVSLERIDDAYAETPGERYLLEVTVAPNFHVRTFNITKRDMIPRSVR